MEHRGGCHCGNISLTFSTAAVPEHMTPIACQCSFCRKHNVLAVADAAGLLDLRIASDADTNRYRFGLATAEYLICRTCGVYVAALTTDPPVRALIVVNCLDDRDRFTAAPIRADYSNETAEQRKARRQRNWTPLLS
ncbi:GFA family protein [Hoeflea sp.]|uniref:GFA family protein n=1 Tax=Hoeflea sp. TaxID=1940281 RepID=UPI003B010257